MRFGSAGIPIGFQARLFPSNWRPLSDEIAFAAGQGFEALQLRAPESGLSAEQLGSPVESLAAVLNRTPIVLVVETIIKLDRRGKTATDTFPVDALVASLPLIRALPCAHAHWHMAALPEVSHEAWTALERALVPQFRAAAQASQEAGARFAVENGDDAALFSTPSACGMLLDAVPGLGLVWDVNHTAPGDVAGFQTLAPRVSQLHIADTQLPTANEHLPLGEGNLDLPAYLRPLVSLGFQGSAILEIGGLPKSGGFGRDTDTALIHSRQRLIEALRRC